MGEYSRGKTSERFIEEFGKEILEKEHVSLPGLLKEYENFLGIDEHDQTVHLSIKIVDGSKERVLVDPFVLYDPDAGTDELIETLTSYLGLSEEEARLRLEKADLL